jgi:phage baseplate assembly protein W
VRQFGFPYGIDATGQTATADSDAHIRQLIEQVLFTAPQERVNRPTFGSGLLNLLFAPNSNEVASATQFLVQGALQQVLADRVTVDMVTATSDEGSITVVVRYTIKPSGIKSSAEFTRSI